jgi:predicted nucleotidyltransferase
MTAHSFGRVRGLLGAIRYKLKRLLGVSVDVLTPRALSKKM